MTHHDVVIVGAGHAGAQAAIQLRQLGFEGSSLENLVAGAAPEPHEPLVAVPSKKSND